MGAILSTCLGYLSIIAVSFLAGLLWFQHHQSRLLRQFRREQRELAREMQRMRLLREFRDQRED